MPDSFDPYHKWLGIPPAEQPPHAYRLLGIQAFETDLDVIETAAEQRMALLRTRQTGAQAQLSQKLLNEVSAARVTLLNPAKKTAYDQQLHAHQAAAQQTAAQKELRTREAMPVAKALPVAAAATPSAPQPAAMVPEIHVEPSGADATRTGHGAKKKSTSPLVFAALGVGVILIGGLIFSLKRGGNVPEKSGGETLAKKAETPGTGQGKTPTADPTQPATPATDPGSQPKKETPKTKQPDSAQEKVVATQPKPKEQGDPTTNEKTSDVTAEEPTEGSATSEPVPGAQPWPFETPTVDLLAAAGELPDAAGWKPEGAEYVSSADGDARLPLTDKPIDSYRLSFELQRVSGMGPVAIGFPILGRQFVYVFDGDGGGHSGLDGWEGKPYANNPSTRTGNLLGSNKPAKIEIEARPDQLTVLVDGKAVFNEQLVLGPWRTLRATSLTAESGNKFKQLEDGSYLLQSPFPERDVFTFEGPTGGLPVAAIRVEPLPDASLTDQGPGAGDLGNFVLNKVELEGKATPRSSEEYKPLVLVAGDATFNQGGYDAASCVTTGQPGWAIYPAAGKRNVAAFFLERPANRVAAVRFKMPFAWGARTVLGRFRISIADSLAAARSLPFVETSRMESVDPRWKENSSRGVFVVTSEAGMRLTKAQASSLVPAAPRRPIDLLAKIDTDRDKILGTWTTNAGELRAEGGNARLQLPVAVPGDFKLSVRVKRLDSQDWRMFAFGFLMRGHRGLMFADNQQMSGIHQLDQKDLGVNESTSRGWVFETGKEAKLDLIVRGNRVMLVADGKTICEWQGDPARMNVPYDWNIYDKSALYLVSHSPHVFSAVEFTPLSSLGAGAAPGGAVESDGPVAEETTTPLLAPPTSNELTTARKAMREKYAEIFAEAKKPEEKFKLVEALIQQGSAQFDNPLERFVLLEEARTLAEDLGIYQVTIKAIDALAETHDVDSDALTASAFMAAIKKVKTPAENAAAARVGLGLIDQFAESNMEAAESIRKALPGLAAKARDANLQRDIKEAGANLILRKKLSDAYLAAAEVLKKDPKDKAANLAVGTYLAVCTNDTDQALQHLMLGGDEKLAALAKAEADPPKESEAQLALAADWQAWATTSGGDLKTFALENAVRWYEAAAPSLTGLKKAKIDKDLAEVRESLKNAPKMTKTARASQGRTLKVVSARYGAEGSWTECTKELAALVKEERLVASAVGAREGITQITVRIGGQEVKQEFSGGDHILIEAPGRRRPPAASRDLTILDARAGLGMKWADVTEVVQKRVQGNRLELRINTNELVQVDLAPGIVKLLFVNWSYNGEEHAEFFAEGTTLNLGDAK